MQYTATSGSCPQNMKLEDKSNSFLQGTGSGGTKLGMTGWRKLPENKAEPLLLALYEQGPVVVSVAAGPEWSMYSTGVMGCPNEEVVINHAVVASGFGLDK